MQDDLFLKASEIAEHWPVLVFVPLRPETFHRSRRDGALTGYHPKAFAISPPAATKVLEKRLTFAVKLLDGTITLPLGQSSHRLADLEVLVKALLSSIEQNTDLAEFIENISGGNIRSALDITRGFFGSGHVDTPKIVRKVRETGGYLVPLHEFLRAVIYGDCIHYSPETSPAANLFDISSPDPREHFAMPLLLALLRRRMQSISGSGFVEISEVFDVCQGLGFTPDQIDFAVVRGCRKKLIETQTREMPDETKSHLRGVRITSIGMYHIARLCGMFTYLDAIVVATPVLNETIRAQDR